MDTWIIVKTINVDVEQLHGKACKDIYGEERGDNSTIDFSREINGITCKGKNMKYHCLRDEYDREVQVCMEWSWMDPGIVLHISDLFLYC